MKIILETKETEIVEKKSRFIANIAAVSSEEEAIEFIEKIKTDLGKGLKSVFLGSVFLIFIFNRECICLL